MAIPGETELRVHLPIPYTQAIDRAKSVLAEQGFGILTEIDVKDTLKRKIGVEFRDYVILGACNPQLSHQAFQHELEIGLLLPCNVIIYEAEGGSVVSVMDPQMMVAVTDNPAMTDIANQARSKLVLALAKIKS